MNALIYGLLTGGIVVIIKYILSKTGNKEAFEIQNNLYRDEVKKLIKERDEISISSINEVEEEEFWSVLEKIQRRAKNNYKYQVGLLKDYFLEKDENYILGFYYYYLRIINNNSTFKLIGGFQFY
jgi:hypothetical protein